MLLRLDKAVYKAGEAVKVDVRSSAGLPTVYLDVVRSGQTVLTKWLDVKDGKADYTLDLPQSLFGTLEIHAYQMLAGGEIIRDSRVVYVQPADDLKIDVKADRDVYLPGAEGKITFRVTDADGKPTAAALGVLVVDEAVYALQEMQPGLEKVYFTLQEELLKPQAQVLYKPSETIDTLVRQPALTRRPAADRGGAADGGEAEAAGALGRQSRRGTPAEDAGPGRSRSAGPSTTTPSRSRSWCRTRTPRRGPSSRTCSRSWPTRSRSTRRC